MNDKSMVNKEPVWKKCTCFLFVPLIYQYIYDKICERRMEDKSACAERDKIMKLRDVGMNTIVPMTLMVIGAEEKIAKTGNPYVVMTATDGTDNINVNVWGTKLVDFEYKKGDLVLARLNKTTYNGATDWKLEKNGLSRGQGNIQDYIRVAPMDAEAGYVYMLDTVRTFKDKGLGFLVESLLMKNKEKLLYWSAAKKMHHNLYGGLMYHTARMLKAAKHLTPIYSEVNADILYAGVILHDIGKIYELNTDQLGTAEYTVNGQLFGHSLIAIQMIIEERNKSGISVSDEVMKQLVHCIASHHGKLEYGAIVKPATQEAFLLHELDMIDSHMYQYEEAGDSINPGECSDRVFGLDNTVVYKPVREPEVG